MTPDEEWRPVVGYEDTHEVSDHGRVRTVPRVIETGNGPRRYPGRVLKTYFGPYEQTAVTIYGKTRLLRVHVAVAAAFIGPRPDGMFVCHKDDDKTNNRLANLRYDTPSANGLEAADNGRNVLANRTHCEKGHEYTPENTRPREKSRGRRCLTCKREQVRRGDRKRRAKAKEQREAAA